MMQNATIQLPATSAAHSMPVRPTLEQITRPTLTTEEAAHYLNRKPQTLRAWACLQPAGMPRPIRINGRLAWKVSDIKALLNGECSI